MYSTRVLKGMVTFISINRIFLKIQYFSSQIFYLEKLFKSSTFEYIYIYNIETTIMLWYIQRWIENIKVYQTLITYTQSLIIYQLSPNNKIDDRLDIQALK
jgi:hypothetical protein